MDDANPPITPADTCPPLQRLAEVALIVLVFFVLAGDPPPNVNEPHYLCRLKHFWNPAWCAGDLFLESTDTQVAFMWTFGWLTRCVSLSATAWIGRLVAWTLLAWAWQRLSWRLVPQSWAAVLSAALFVTLTADAHLAGEWVVGGVEAKCFAYFFVLFALRELIDCRWNTVWFLLGTACAFHSLVGGWSGLVCSGMWLFNDREQAPLRSMTPGIVAGGIMALVGILPALTLTLYVPVEVAAESARIYVFERLPHHLAPLTLPRDEVALRFSLHAMLIAALWLLIRGANTLTIPTEPLWPIGQFAWGAVMLAMVGLTIELVLWNHHLLAAQLLRYYWFRLSDFAVPMAVSLYVVAIIASGLERQRSWAVWALTILIVLLAWQLSSTARQRAIFPIPPADARVRDYAAWVDVCDWVAENTPADAVFLTPRSSQSFKWRTGRAEVATRKDIPQDAASMVEWWERLQKIFRRQAKGATDWVDSPGELDTDRVRELADEYRFNYILSLTDREQALSLPIAYENDEYVVYQIKN